MIFFRAYLLIMFITLNTWCIANSKIYLTLFLSFCISLTWAFNVNSMAKGGIKEKIYYSCGAFCGTATALVIADLLQNY